MNEFLAEKLDCTSGRSKVIPFRNYGKETRSEATLESMFLDFLKMPEFEEHLKGMMEAAVINAWIKVRLFDIQSQDDPFDAIYFSELTPDRVTKRAISRFQKYSQIRDLSDTISFVDEWDD